MKKRVAAFVGIASVAALTIAGTITAADDVTVTPDDVGPEHGSGAWFETNVRGDGASEISSAVPDQNGGDGSLQQSFSDGSGKTDFRYLDDFGPIEELSALGFDWYRDSSSTAPAHLTPAIGVFVADDSGNSWLLKWEGVYNGYPSNGPAAPTDEWVTENLLDANFWRIPQTVGGAWVGFAGCNETDDPYACFQFDRSLSDEWLDGFDVVGIEIGIGSGWNGTFLSYADLVTVNDTTFDFELTAGVVLEGKDDCKKGGWATSTDPVFRNQGQCVSYFQAAPQAGKR